MKKTSKFVATGRNDRSAAAAFGRRQMRPVPPVLANAADTSRDSQRQIRQPGEPFSSPHGATQTRTGRVSNPSLGIPYTKPAPVNARPQSYGKRAGVANTSLSAQEMAAVGYGPSATRSSNPIISGHPTRNQSRSTGPSSQPKALGGRQPSTSRGQQSIPARETGAVRRDYSGTRNNMRMPQGPMYTQGRPGSRGHSSATAGRSNKKGEAPFYGQR